MKFLVSQLAYFFRIPEAQRNARTLVKFLAVLAGMMVLYSILFHFIALAEGQDHSWLSGLYWTVVTMTTLGYGDIVFQSDLGRMFATVVLVSGVLFLLVMLPFTFIQFFYAPWLEAQRHTRAPRQVPPDTRGHVIMTYLDPVAVTLVERLRHFGREYVLLEPDFGRATKLSDEGYRVMVGEPDDVETYRRAGAERAALVFANGDDYQNTNIAFTVRALSADVPIVAKVRNSASTDVVQLAGATHVVELAEMLGRALARRTMGGEARANVVGSFRDLLVAEAPVTGTPLVGKSLAESRVREVTGVTVVGLWERGQFLVPRPDVQIQASAVLVLAGTEEDFVRFDELFCIYNAPEDPVLILGGGRVGRCVARSLREREVDYRIVEKDPGRIRDPEKYVLGSAAELWVLEAAGIEKAPSTIVTTNDDSTNVYLTIYCRRLRPDMQIIARATMERNVAALHRAGADFVMSYASMGSNAVFNALEREDVVMLAEGLDVFRFRIPPSLAGKTLIESGIREKTGCSVIALEVLSGTIPNPEPNAPLPAVGELILIGDPEAERAFLERYGGEPAKLPR